MSRPVDEKIVKITLDHSDLSKKSQESMSIFEKMKRAFSKDLKVNVGSDMNKSLKQVNLDHIAEGVDKINSRFTFMGQLGQRAINGIITTAKNGFNALQNMTGLGTGGIRDGFKEYELEMKSIQTIMANTKGKSSFEDVKNTLKELNKYADDTIYNFAEMTSNLGKFTAAGVGLEDSTLAIKGLMNLAATNGAGAEDAARASYQVSQALAKGYFQLIDWKSLTNASMDGKLIQDQMVASYKALNGGKNPLVNKKGKPATFNESLSTGWLDNKTFLHAMREFANSKEMTDNATMTKSFTEAFQQIREGIGSGWAETWRIVFGDFYEARQFFTNFKNYFSDIFSEMARKRNEFMQGFKNAKGIENVFGGLKNIWEGLAAVVNAFKAGFREVFPPLTVERAASIAEAFRKLTEHLKPTEFALGLINKSGRILGGTLKGLYKVVKTVIDIFIKLGEPIVSAGLKILAEFAQTLSTFMDEVINSSWGMTVYAETTEKAAQVTKIYKENSDDLFGLLKNLTNIDIVGWIKGIGPAFESAVEPVAAFLSTITASDIIRGGLFVGLILFTKRITGFSKAVTNVAESVDNFVDSAKGLFGITKILNKIVMVGSIAVVAYSIKTIAEAMIELSRVDAGKLVMVTSILGGALIAITGVTAALGVLAKNNNNMQGLGMTLLGLGIIFTQITKIVKNMENVSFGSAMASIIAMTGILGAIGTFLAFADKMGNINWKSALSIVLILTVLKSISKNIKMISDAGIGNDKGVLLAISAITVILGELTAMLFLADKISGDGFKNISGMAAVIVAIASALKIIASIENPMKPILVLGGIIGGLTGVLFALGKIPPVNLNVVGRTFKQLSIAILAIAGSMFILSTISPDKILVSMIAIGGISTGMVFMLKAISKIQKNTAGIKPGSLDEAAKVIQKMSISMLAIAASMRIIGGMDPQKMLASAFVMAGMLTAMGLVLSLTTKLTSKKSKPKAISTMGASIVGLSLAMIPIAIAMRIIGSMKPQQIGTAGLVIGALIGVMGVFAKLSNGAKLGAVGFALAGLGVALMAVVPAIMTFGNMPIEQLLKGIGAVSIILLSIGAAIKLGSSIKGMASLLVTLFAISQMVGPLQALGSIPTEVMIKAGLAVVGLLAVIVSLKLISDMLAKVSWGTLAKTFLSLAAVILTMSGLSATISTFASIDFGTLAKAFGSLAAVIGTVWIIQNMKVNMGNVGKVILSMIGVTLSMAALSSAINTFAGIDFNTLAMGFIALGGAILAVKVIEKTKISLKDLLNIGKALLAVSAIAIPMTLLGNAVKTFQGVDFNLLGVAFGALVAAFAVAVGLGAVTAIVLPLIPQIATGLAILGGLGVVIGLFAGAMALFATAIGSMIDSLTKVQTAPLEGFEKIGQVVKGFLDLIIGLAPKIAEAGVKIILALVTSLAQNMPKLVQQGANLVVSLLNGLAQNMGNIISAGLNVVVSFIKGLVDNIDMVIDAGVYFVVKLVTGIVDGVKRHAGLIVNVFKMIIGEALKGLIDMAVGLVGWIPLVGGWVKEAGGAAKAGIDGLFDIEGTREQIDKLGDSIEEKLTTNGEKIKPAAEGFKTTISNAFSFTPEETEAFKGKVLAFAKTVPDTFVSQEVKDMIIANGGAFNNDIAQKLVDEGTFQKIIAKGQQIPSELVTGMLQMGWLINQGTGEVKRLTETQLNSIKSNAGEDVVNEIGRDLFGTTWKAVEGAANVKKNAEAELNTMKSDAGAKTGQQVADGLKSKAGAVRYAAGDVKNAAKSGLNSMSDGAYSQGSNTGQQVANGLASKKNEVWYKGRDLSVNAKKGTESVSLYSSGAYLVDGLTKGMRDNMYKAMAAAQAMGGGIKTRFTSTTHIASPSKDFIRYGKWISEGLAIGITKTADKAYNSASDLGHNALSGMKTAMGAMQDALNSALDYNPVITPVIDDSQLKSVYTNYSSDIKMSGALERRYMPKQTASQPSSNTSNTYNINIASNSAIPNPRDFARQIKVEIDRMQAKQIYNQGGVMI